DPINDNRTVRDHYNQLTVHLEERGAQTSARRRLDIVFRAYDSGVAFRYVLLGQAPSPYHEPVDPPLRNFTLSSEDTGFYFARPAAAFALDLGSFTTPYEDEFRQVALGEIKPSSLIGLPLLVQVPRWAVGGHYGGRSGGLCRDLSYGRSQGSEWSCYKTLAPARPWSPSGNRLGAEGHALARVAGERRARRADRVSRPGTQSQSALRVRGHLVDRAGQDGVGLVVGRLRHRSEVC